MRYEESSKHKSEIDCCFQTNPLKVIWSSAANYRAFWAPSRLDRTPPPPFPTSPPTAPFSVHHIPSLCFRSLFSATALLLRSWELTGSPVTRGLRDSPASQSLSLCLFGSGIPPREVVACSRGVPLGPYAVVERHRRWGSKINRLTRSECSGRMLLRWSLCPLRRDMTD